MEVHQIIEVIESGQAVVPDNNKSGYPYAHNYRVFWQHIANGWWKQIEDGNIPTNKQIAAYLHATELAAYYALYDAITPPNPPLAAMLGIDGRE